LVGQSYGVKMCSLDRMHGATSHACIGDTSNDIDSFNANSKKSKYFNSQNDSILICVHCEVNFNGSLQLRPHAGMLL
jgi:hypothetical protein